MKFAKRIEAEAVAEWRPKYLQYKQLKKAIKAITAPRAVTPTSTTKLCDIGCTSVGSLSREEEMFFESLEGELLKVDEFYRQREKEAVEKKFKIMAQLHFIPETTESKKGKK